ncbi:MAG: hypothetical protein ACFFD4_02615 [Candidatus Odinarchaeota archaeon]
MVDEDWPTECPACKSDNFEWENKRDYTGGGYSDYWIEYFCKNCGHSWRSEVRTSLF